jgi:hypothetical protein
MRGGPRVRRSVTLEMPDPFTGNGRLVYLLYPCADSTTGRHNYYPTKRGINDTRSISARSHLDPVLRRWTGSVDLAVRSILCFGEGQVPCRGSSSLSRRLSSRGEPCGGRLCRLRVGHQFHHMRLHGGSVRTQDSRGHLSSGTSRPTAVPDHLFFSFLGWHLSAHQGHGRLSDGSLDPFGGRRGNPPARARA